MFIHASRTLKLPLLQREQVWQGLKGVLCHGCGGWGFGMFRGCGDPCSPLWTQNFSAFRSRVTHESQGCSLAVSEWKKSEKWREGKDFMRSVMKVDGWCSEILWRLLSKKLPTLTCGINRINCQTFIYPTIGRSRLLKGLLTSCWTCLTVGYLQLCLLSRLKCEAASIFCCQKKSLHLPPRRLKFCAKSHFPFQPFPLKGNPPLPPFMPAAIFAMADAMLAMGFIPPIGPGFIGPLAKPLAAPFGATGAPLLSPFPGPRALKNCLKLHKTKQFWNKKRLKVMVTATGQIHHKKYK